MAEFKAYTQFDALVGATEFFNIEPATTKEIVVHNITVNPASQASVTTLEVWNGSVACVVDSITGSGSWMGMFLHCANNATDGGTYYRVNPTDATNTVICCDGVVMV